MVFICSNEYDRKMVKNPQFYLGKPPFQRWCARRGSNAQPTAPEAVALSSWTTGANGSRTLTQFNELAIQGFVGYPVREPPACGISQCHCGRLQFYPPCRKLFARTSER